LNTHRLLSIFFFLDKIKEESGPKAEGAEEEKPPGDDSQNTQAPNDEADADKEEEENKAEGEEDESIPAPAAQADCVSISYDRNTRRMRIDSDSVESIRIFRAEFRIEVVVRLMPAIIQGGKFDGAVDPYRICKGVLVRLSPIGLLVASYILLIFFLA
jgi:hypothetical protein